MPSIMRRAEIIRRASGMYLVQQLEDSELSAVHYSYIHKICKYPGMSQIKLGKSLCISKSNVTRHLAFLEKNGYIERKNSAEDKREVLIFPTQKMLDIYPRVLELHKKWDLLVTSDMDEKEKEVFYALMKKVLEKSLSVIDREV